MLFITHTSTLASICLILIVMVVHSLKMGKSNSIVSDHELIQLRNQLLAELVGQIKESISIGRSCHEQLRLVDGQELVESGQNLLVLIKSREKDFANVFGDTPEVVDRIVSSVEQKVFICHAESNRQILNGLLKIYSQPLLQNETVNLTSMLRGAKTVAHNLTMTFKLDAAKFLLQALNEQIDDSVVLAERYSAIARSMSSTQHRASNRYYYMQLSQALGDSFHSVLNSLYHFSSMVWQVYVQQNPKTSIPMTLLPMSQRDQRGIEQFLQEQQMLYTQPYFQVFHRRFQVKFKSSSVLFYVKCSDPFVLRIDNDICADQGSRIADETNPKDVDITCEAYMEENTTVDIFLYVLNPSLGSTETAPLATPPRLLAAREDIMEAFEIKLRRFALPSSTAGSGTSAGKTST